MRKVINKMDPSDDPESGPSAVSVSLAHDKITCKIFSLDISGSMSALATSGSESTGEQNVGLISKIVSSVIGSMTPNQRAGIVTFNHAASTLYPIAEMNDLNRQSAISVLKETKANGSTNLWGAIELSVRLLHANSKKNGECPSSVDLLTDGVPNVDPPNLRGYLASLDDLSVLLDGFMPSINIFGFGNEIDLTLLESIAIKTGGHFSYISDPGMAATAFVNSAAVWGAQDKQVDLDLTSDVCRRDLVLAIRAMRKYCSLSNFSAAQYTNQALIKSIEDSVSSAPAGSTATYILGEFLKDLYGEVALSISDAGTFKKWGNNYLTSLSRAHELKICANFKDKGLQVYQTEPLFPILQKCVASSFTEAMKRLASEGEARAASIGSAAANAVAAAASRSLSNMYNPHGGCVDARCIVSMADGSFKYLEYVKIGDKILGGADGLSIVEVYEKVTTKPRHNTDLAYFSNTSFSAGGLSSSFVLATSWHPVLFRSARKTEWQFPFKSEFPKMLAPSGAIVDHGFENVISIAVRGEKGEHGFLVNNSIICATLAHGVMGDPVLTHPFWGTDRVIAAIRDMKVKSALRGMYNPILGAGPFDWAFSQQTTECIGIAEKEMVIPKTPSRLSSGRVSEPWQVSDIKEMIKSALLSSSSSFHVTEASDSEY